MVGMKDRSENSETPDIAIMHRSALPLLLRCQGSPNSQTFIFHSPLLSSQTSLSEDLRKLIPVRENNIPLRWVCFFSARWTGHSWWITGGVIAGGYWAILEEAGGSCRTPWGVVARGYLISWTHQSLGEAHLPVRLYRSVSRIRLSDWNARKVGSF